MTLEYDRERLNNVCAKNRIKYLGLFGSFARGEADSQSDVDLIVEFYETPSLLRHVGIEYELSENLFSNRKVDLITRRSLKESLRSRVNEDLVTLYEDKQR